MRVLKIFGLIGRFELRVNQRARFSFIRPPRIAVVGSGPAGLFVCSSLLRRLKTCEIDVFDKSPTPYGLIRYGVAPDHQDVKNCTKIFEKMFTENVERISLFCDVEIGRDLMYDELCRDYDAIVLAYGSRRQRRLNIPGIELSNVFSGADFVSWYNAAPESRSPSLNCKKAVIIGNGNVSLDCCRMILLAGSEKLSKTDIPIKVIDQLSQSTIDKVTIIGRRGPLDVSFTIKELRELSRLSNCLLNIDIANFDMELIESSLETLSRPKRRLIELMLSFVEKNELALDHSCQLLFRRIPLKLIGNENGCVEAIEVKNTLTHQVERFECGLFIYSIGYENFVLDGIPKNENGEIALIDSSKVESDSNVLVYACGWCAHAPKGMIANTQIESANVAIRLSEDLEKQGIIKSLESCGKERIISRGVKFFSWEDWKRIDEEEKKLGRLHGKEREKIIP